MRQSTGNGWRWLVWSLSLLVFVITGAVWSQWTRIEDAGHLRIGFACLQWGAMLGAVFAFPKLSRGKALLLLGLGAVVVRLAFWGAPVSNDVNRYLWEGRLLWMGENPYATVAFDEQWEHLRDEYWEGMNTRDRMTAYPPGMELIMAGASWVWYDLWVFKIVALVGDLWVLALLVILSREYRKPVRWLGFYAFNPIVIASFAVEGHFDSMMVAPMLTAVWLASRAGWKRAWFWLGVAVQMKLMALLVVPLFVVAKMRQKDLALVSLPRVMVREAWPFLLVLVIPSLVFWEYLWAMGYGLFAFGSEGAFNGGVFETLRWLSASDGPTRLLGTTLFGCGVLVVLWRVWRGKSRDLFESTFHLFLLLLIFSPVVHFWYLSWIVWFLVLRPTASLIVECLTNSVYFLAWMMSELGRGWGYPREVVVATWAPFLLLLLWEHRHLWSRWRTKPWPQARSFSLVVPVYREGDRLGEFLGKLQQASPGVEEILVVDGAGELGTEGHGWGELVRVIPSERGRGLQIAKGVQESTGDLIAIVHADTEPQEGWLEEVVRSAEKCPRAVAFALGQRFSNQTFGLLGVEALNEMRVSFGGSVFGDQTMIIRRAALEKAGGFPEQPLMEDVEVSARLRVFGPIEYLGQEWVVSAQKWQRGFKSRFWQVIGLMTRYGWTRLRGVKHAERLSQQLFEEYYPAATKSEQER